MIMFGLLFKPLLLLAAEPTVLPDAASALPDAASALTNDVPAASTEVTRLEINVKRRRVTVYRGKTAVKSYPIAVGRAGWETPSGSFKVHQMYRDPAWMSPFTGAVIPGGSPANPLGRYWIGFWTDGKNWIGFHGTPNTKSVGTAASHGCIRMYNKDVQELFNQVSIGTPVTVVR
ncbi:MAG: L,D-transpeptidase [Aphanothece sp. CMT-3BRIN-NPC111]|nr:L,D-transpeptidase [Aphanothece sp. CMT-3BRIN-NPC111]